MVFEKWVSLAITINLRNEKRGENGGFFIELITLIVFDKHLDIKTVVISIKKMKIGKKG